MPSLEIDEKEVKKGKGLKILTPSKLLSTLPTLLAQIKARNKLIQIKEWNQTNYISFVSA